MIFIWKIKFAYYFDVIQPNNNFDVIKPAKNWDGVREKERKTEQQIRKNRVS